jgi:NADPH:quinone reductase-like Zn-dependent oxidoreductase
MKSMRAIRFSSYGPPDVLTYGTVDKPSPSDGQILIEVVASGVNPADHKWRSGMFQQMVPLPMPHVLGYDVAGTVSAMGGTVEGLQLCDRVLAMLHPLTKGGYAEYAIAEASAVCRLPDGFDLNLAASLPTAALTGVQLINEHARPGPGDTILITGALGAVGRFAMLAALDAGASVIAAVRPDQKDEALALGASQALGLGEPLPKDLSINHLVDTVGGPDVAELARYVSDNGRILTVSTTPIDPAGLPVAPVFVTVRPDGPMLGQIVQRVAQGDLVPLPVRVMSLGEAAEAHRLMQAGGLRARIVLKP